MKEVAKERLWRLSLAELIAILKTGLDDSRSDKELYDEAPFLSLLGFGLPHLGEPRKAIEYYVAATEDNLRDRR